MTFATAIAALPSRLTTRERLEMMALLTENTVEQVMTMMKCTLSPLVRLNYRIACIRLRRGRPLQYACRRAFFAGRILAVNSHTLIPRPETETLCNIVVDKMAELKLNEGTLIDVGTGTGAIAVTLAEHWNGTVLATDISRRALRVARQNTNYYRRNITCVRSDLLSFLNEKKWNMTAIQAVVANLPYLADVSMAAESVAKHEPHLALFAEEQGLAQIKRLLQQTAKLNFCPRLIALEFSPEQYEKIETIFSQLLPGWQYVFSKDNNEMMRFVTAWKI